MFDIIQDEKLAKKLEERGIEPLILGKEVKHVKDMKELSKAKALIVLGTSNERKLIEGPIDGVTQLEQNAKKDHLHFRKAGLDQVTGKILGKDRKALILSYSDVRKSKEPGKLLGRMMQNARIAKKYKIPVIPCTYATSEEELLEQEDLHAFFRAMGVDAQALQDGKKGAEEWLERARLRASDEYVAEGVRRIDSKK